MSIVLRLPHTAFTIEDRAQLGGRRSVQEEDVLLGISWGVSAYYRDSPACLVQDGEIIAAAREERLTRKKHDPGFPHRAVEFCLRAGGIQLKVVNYLVF